MARAKSKAVAEDPTQRPGEARSDYAQVWKGNIWIGFFIDHETALGWVNGRKGYVINNVPPATSTLNRRAVLPPSQRRPLWERPAATAPARPSRRAKPVVPEAPQSSEVKALRQDAAKRLDKHKADEAADLAAGINR